MGTEELQLVLTMVQQAGEGAFTLACIYLGVGFLKGLIAPSVWLVFFVLVYKGGKYAFDRVHVDKPTKLDEIQAKIKCQLDWAKTMYPNLTKAAAEKFVRGETNSIDASGL